MSSDEEDAGDGDDHLKCNKQTVKRRLRVCQLMVSCV